MSNKDLTVSNISGGSYFPLCSGCHGVKTINHANIYSIKIDVRGSGSIINDGIKGNIMIGFATKNFNPSSRNYETNGWFIDVVHGSLWSKDGDWKRKYYNHITEYTASIEIGDVITAIFDVKQSQISFLVNGEDLGIAFKNVNEERLYPAIEMFDEDRSEQGAKITLV